MKSGGPHNRRLIDDRRVAELMSEVGDLALFTLDAEGVCTRWEPVSANMKLMRPNEVVGRCFEEFFPEDQRKLGTFWEELERAAETGRSDGEGWRARRDGTRRWTRYTLLPECDDEGRVTGYLGVVSDATREKNSSNALAEAHDALDRSEKLRSLGELTGGIAHDFNNLLTVVRGSAELLQSSQLPEHKRERHIQAIVETADRAAELTGQLLSFGRRQALQPKPTDLNAVIADMTELLRRTLGGQVSVLKAPQPGLWRVEADPTQLNNLILNAALNARDAMDGVGTLTIATRNVTGANGEEVRLSISDTGRGMAPDVKERAFEPFFTTKPLGEGTGLGLSQAYGFAAQSGGRLELRSELGRGTTLQLYLPRLEGDSTADEAPDAEGELPHGTRILLVEDSRTVARFAQSLLEEMGCSIVHAADAEEALMLLGEKDQHFDVVFSDIVMPGLSGLDLAARVREQKPTLPILLATGYSEAAARGQGTEFPIVHKPYRRDALAEKLGQAMFSAKKAA